MSSYYKLFKDSKSEYRWTLYAPNHEPIATSEGYTTKQNAELSITRNRTVAQTQIVKDETARVA